MAHLYGLHYSRIWTEALLHPGEPNLWDSLARELGGNLGRTPQVAKAAMEQVWRERPVPDVASNLIPPRG